MFLRRTDSQPAERTLLSPGDFHSLPVKLGVVAMYVALLVLAAISLLPLLWMVLGALKRTTEIYASPPQFWPQEWLWGNIADIWSRRNFPLYFKNTLVIFLGTWVTNLGSSSLAAYAIAKLKPRFHRFFFYAFIATLMVPYQAYLIPQFLNLQSLHLIGVRLLGTYWGLWLPAGVNAFGIFLLSGFFESIPDDYLDAARIEGASELRIFAHIILPLSRPILAVLTIFVFIDTWKSFLWPLLVLSNERQQPIMVMLYRMQQFGGLEWNLVLSALVIATLPPIFVFLLFQRQIVSGMLASGLKG